MCYEMYDRLLRTRAARRTADRPAAPDPEQPKPEATPVEPARTDEVVREKEPA